MHNCAFAALAAAIEKRSLVETVHSSIQVTCFPLYPCKVSPTIISLPSNATETNLVIGWKLLSLGRPNPIKTSGVTMKMTSCFLQDPHHIPYDSALRIWGSCGSSLVNGGRSIRQRKTCYSLVILVRRYNPSMTTILKTTVHVIVCRMPSQNWKIFIKSVKHYVKESFEAGFSKLHAYKIVEMLTRLGHMVFFFYPQRGIFDAIL